MSGDELFAEVMRRLESIQCKSTCPANAAPKMELNQKQSAIEVVMKYSDIYCMSCHDSGKSRGDVDIEQFHDDPSALAGNPMIKMFAAALEKKNAPTPAATATINQRKS